MSDRDFDNSAIFVNTDSRTPRDKVTGGVCTTDSNHSQVHAGNAFHYSTPLSLTTGSSQSFTLDVPTAAYVHFQSVQAILSQQFTVTVVEGDTPATGTEFTPLNRNRLSSDSTLLIGHDTPVSTSTVTLVDVTYPASIQGGSGVVEESIEWVLGKDKSYTFTVTNNGSQTGVGFIKLDWYEEQ